ncbi:hypothetical protein [Marivirga harenae]|uniref:hypothetical protein n=1 Tax=Marivirga harenae TaxID=2010992 RepID=UPI0026E0D7C2|nr:hypothetical protein [Marivirga harenae]WKV11869.1 hypothetical protein Q3Y49_16835 [Marivirga harenae]|tara:strand:- start:52597 stop:53568 length:972 start_codon:yes stop_codon:yes gene_type:complete
MKALIFILFLLSALPVIGQNCCTGGSPLANNLNLSNLDSGLSVQMVYDRNLMNDFVSGSEVLDDESYNRYNSSVFLQVSWALNNDLTFGMMLNHSTHYLNRKTINADRETKSRGIGDLILTSNYNIWQQGKHNVQIGAGLVLPTGNNANRDENFDILLPWDLQPGYGGWGGVLMAQYQNGRIIMDNLNYFGLLVYQYLLNNQKPGTAQFFQQGSEYQFYQGLGYNIYLNNNILLAPQAGFRIKYTNKDRINDALVESSGGIWVYNMLGLNILLPNNLTFMLAYENPVFRKLNGSQLTTSARFRFGINMFIGAKEEPRERRFNF